MDMINLYRNKLEQLKGKKSFIKNKLSQKKILLKDKQLSFNITQQTFDIIQKKAFETQNNIKLHITNIVNLAIESIPFENKPDCFDLEFVYRRNQIECDFFYMENNQRLNPLRCGGGLLDIVSFALRIACLTLRKNKNNVILFDESFKNINDPDQKRELKYYVSEILKKLSDKLNLQFIIVGSNDDFLEIADKVFQISLDNGVSNVK